MALLHPDDEPYLVLEDTSFLMDDAPRTRVAVARDGSWIATDTHDACVRAWPVGKPQAVVRVVAPAAAHAGAGAGAGVADILWIDDMGGKAGGQVCAAVFVGGWIRCVAVESRSIVADVQLPLGVTAAAAVAGGNLVVAAGSCGVCLVTIKMASVACQVGLPAGHDEADKVLHVVVVDASAGATGARLVLVVSANWVHIFGPPTLLVSHISIFFFARQTHR